MSHQPSGGPELRIGDAEREAAVSALGEHYVAGRLTREEYDERARQAWAARTRSALWPLFVDLPRPPAAVQAVQPAAPSGSRAIPRERGGRGWWTGIPVAPVLLTLLAVMVLAEAPLFVLVLVAWLMWVKLFRHRPRRSHQRPAHW